MYIDFLLASLHHLLAFGLMAMLVTQSVLLSRPVDTATLRRLFGVDRGYGLVAALLLVAGLLRVFHGVKGSGFYLHNPWFHAKLGAFFLAAALSLLPTLGYLRWRKALRTDSSYTPPVSEVARLRRITHLEILLIAVILVVAAGMARYGGLML